MNFNHGAMRGAGGGMDIQSLLQQITGGIQKPMGGPMDGGGMGNSNADIMAKPAMMGGSPFGAQAGGASGGGYSLRGDSGGGGMQGMLQQLMGRMGPRQGFGQGMGGGMPSQGVPLSALSRRMR